jgi:hypothetical protein
MIDSANDGIHRQQSSRAQLIEGKGDLGRNTFSELGDRESRTSSPEALSEVPVDGDIDMPYSLRDVVSSIEPDYGQSSVFQELSRESPDTRQRSSSAVQVERNHGSQDTGWVAAEPIKRFKEYEIEFADVSDEVANIARSLSFTGNENKPKADAMTGAHDTRTHQERGGLRQRRPYRNRKLKRPKAEDAELELSTEGSPRTDSSAIATAFFSFIDQVKNTVETLVSWFSSANSESDSLWWHFSNGIPVYERERDIDEQERPRTPQLVPVTSGATGRNRLVERQREIAESKAKHMDVVRKARKRPGSRKPITRRMTCNHPGCPHPACRGEEEVDESHPVSVREGRR